MKRGISTLAKSSRMNVVASLLEWYRVQQRTLPWRVDPRCAKNPYAVWISEVMSQQSTLAMMLPYFEKWMKKFPTLESLANAELNEVEPLWAGLGYYSRVRNLHRGARELARWVKGGAGYPSKKEEWLEIPGVGPYTASAIAAICFDEAVVPIDGNALRVFSRFFGIRDVLNSRTDRVQLEEALGTLALAIPRGQRGDFAQAVMDLGAMICRPRALAACESCPLAKGCWARGVGRVADIPRKKERSAMKELYALAPVYRSKKDPSRVLLRQIPVGERLQGQWSLPLWELPASEGSAVLAQLHKKFEVFSPKRHLITHHRYLLFGVAAGLWPAGSLPPGYRFFTIKELFGEGAESGVHLVTTATRKILHFLVDSQS